MSVTTPRLKATAKARARTKTAIHKSVSRGVTLVPAPEKMPARASMHTLKTPRIQEDLKATVREAERKEKVKGNLEAAKAQVLFAAKPSRMLRNCATIISKANAQKAINAPTIIMVRADFMRKATARKETLASSLTMRRPNLAPQLPMPLRRPPPNQGLKRVATMLEAEARKMIMRRRSLIRAIRILHLPIIFRWPFLHIGKWKQKDV